ncbi:hypothetical protein ACP70R_041653 [Stipagrostis hirtigluma subsp. patula]
MLFRLAPRRRAAPGAPQARGRRKRMAVARLGGGGGGGGKRRLFGALRLRVRLRVRWPWLAAVYRRALRRLRAGYAQAVRDLVEGTALMGALQVPVGVDCARAASFGPVATVGF